jgi:membrane fusion protein (multidrug efflux system)
VSSLAAGIAALVVSGCGRDAAPPAPPAVTNVTTVTVAARDVAVIPEFVAQTQSSQSVNIQARVSGFLDKRVYVEGSVVKTGQTLFLMDPKPFQAQVDGAQAALSRQQAAYDVASANLKRVQPLVEQNALSQKDLDDAKGQYEQAGAAVEQAKSQLEEAKLNLSYTTITSPVDGISSNAAVADGTYVSAQNSQLTTVAVLSPMWVNFSVSENEMARIRREQQSGQLKLPQAQAFEAEIVMVDGSLFPFTGRITFTDPSFNQQTGTFLVRISVPNPQGLLRPNQFVRVRIKGATRPNAILVPQRAVQQGARGHFVWIVDKESKAQSRPVEVGDWVGDDWVISQGLAPGDEVIVEGTLRLQPGSPVKASPYVVPKRDAPPAVGTQGAGPGAPPPARASGAPTGAPAVASGTSMIPAQPGASPPMDAMAGAPAQAPSGATTSSAVRAPAAAASTPPAAGGAPSASVYFESGSASLDATARGMLAKLAGQLAGGSKRIAITGYTDRHGDYAANVDLAKRRAAAVRDALTAGGVSDARLQMRPPQNIVGDGTEPMARRVDLFLAD